MHSTNDLIVCMDELNGLVGRHIDGFGVHYWHGIGQRKLEGRMLLEL